MSERSIAAGYRSAAILSLGSDTERTVAALLEPVDGIYRLIDWEIKTGPALPEHMPSHLADVCRRMGERLNRPLWSKTHQPYLVDPSPALGLALGHVVAVADPIPPLRVWVAGVSTGQSLAAAQEALSGAFCEPVAIYAMSALGTPTQLARDLRESAPHAVVIVGGYERVAAREPVLSLAQQIGEAVMTLPAAQRPVLFFAGNRWAASAVLEAWRNQADLEIQILPNLLPTPGQLQPESVAVALSQRYWHECRDHPALAPLARWITQPAVLRSAHWSFAQGVRLWRDLQRLDDLHALYCTPWRWLHVWVRANEVGVRVQFVPPHTRPHTLSQWPPLRLVSGTWPQSLWPQPDQSWLDPLALLPVLANAGQINPAAAAQVLLHDGFRSDIQEV